MKKNLIVLLLLLILTACGETSPEPTATTEPSPTIMPTATIVETAVSPAETGDRQFAPMGRYSFQPVDGYDWEVADGQTFMADNSGSIMISVVGVPANDGTPEMIMEDFISGMAAAGSGALERGEESLIVIDGVEATAVNLSGDLFGSPMEGQAILVLPTDDWAIFTLAMGNLTEDEAQWDEVGQPAFMELLGSMEFLDETAVVELLAAGGGSCLVAADPTYGYSQDNPIQVGGDAENDSARATAYLDNLIDPVGIPVTYSLAGSSPYGDTVLSIYEISSPMVEETINLYIDHYNYSELMAPVGFSCDAAFPISAP